MIPWKKKGTHSKWPPNPTQPTQPAQPTLPNPAQRHASAGCFGFGRRLRDLRLRCRLRACQELGEAGHGLGEARWKDKSHHQNPIPKRKNLKMLENCLKVGFKPPTKSVGKSFFVWTWVLCPFLSPSQKGITFSAKLRQWWKTPSCPANSETRWQIFKAFLKMILLFFSLGGNSSLENIKSVKSDHITPLFRLLALMSSVKPHSIRSFSTIYQRSIHILPPHAGISKDLLNLSHGKFLNF